MNSAESLRDYLVVLEPSHATRNRTEAILESRRLVATLQRELKARAAAAIGSIERVEPLSGDYLPVLELRATQSVADELRSDPRVSAVSPADAEVRLD